MLSILAVFGGCKRILTWPGAEAAVWRCGNIPDGFRIDRPRVSATSHACSMRSIKALVSDHTGVLGLCVIWEGGLHVRWKGKSTYKKRRNRTEPLTRAKTQAALLSKSVQGGTSPLMAVQNQCYLAPEPRRQFGGPGGPTNTDEETLRVKPGTNVDWLELETGERPYGSQRWDV